MDDTTTTTTTTTGNGQKKNTLGDNGNDLDDTMKSSVLRILVATDNHLGYLEKDPIRGEDSFNSFEEILQYAHQLKVDMVLLGGDLFHDNKPSRSCLYKTMELFRKYCLGDSPVRIQFLSDQNVNFSNQFHTVNYEDPNFNISLPIFSIHGNHDDPTGEGGLAALDLLSVSNLVNYFGKSDDIDDISIYPLLLGKGDTKIAIYGLGNIRDERLYRTFSKQKVKMMRPVENTDDWFNILVLHQNRVAHNPKNYVHEKMIDSFVDFVIWGHEHECLINPQASGVGEFHITQPGSSVATALSEGESKDKFVGLLEVFKNQFRFKPYPLNTIRPFILDNIVLSDSNIHPTEQGEIFTYLESKVESMIEEAKEKVRGKPNEKMLPLIRLKVDYTGYSSVNPQKFGQTFAGRVANQNDILLFYRKKTQANSGTKKDIFEGEKTKNQDKIKVGDFISEFLGNTPSDRLQILSESDLHEALHNFVEKEESESLIDLVNLTLTNTHKYLSKNITTQESHEEFIQKYIMDNFPLQKDKIPSTSTTTTPTKSTTKSKNKNNNNNDDEDVDMEREEDSHGHEHSHGGQSPLVSSDDEGDDFNDDMLFSNTTSTTSGKVSQPPTPTVKTRGSAPVINVIDSDSDEDRSVNIGKPAAKTAKKRGKTKNPPDQPPIKKAKGKK
ncbi:DNA repair exonuclease [Tieghemostelium lacteum]|uniref:Double-strand break repair protein n=1 Tax=Tieghemostelium lacteum TaxID=361077 RepID=A0A151ZHP5_TIELA|nr:DNA repair exonuclease [Tieghemostelium lacteum]|eukprot:KYQ93419.1 DNA repair exonuclease [Tieghemostelium lacteum]